MAKALKCDICGTLYEAYSNTKYNTMELVNYNINRIISRSKTFDLCPKCMEKLKRLITNDVDEAFPPSKIYSVKQAYDVLVDIHYHKNSSVDDYRAAVQEAIGYLGEFLND